MCDFLPVTLCGVLLYALQSLCSDLKKKKRQHALAILRCKHVCDFASVLLGCGARVLADCKGLMREDQRPARLGGMVERHHIDMVLEVQNGTVGIV